MKLVSVEKSKAEVYKLRFDNSAYASITLDEISKSAGRISVSCDWGNWSYYWGSMGLPFKEFLSSLNRCYLAGKFGIQYVTDEELTKKEFYDYIKELRRTKEMSAEEATIVIASLKRNVDFSDSSSVAYGDCEGYDILRSKCAGDFIPHEFIQTKSDPAFGWFYDNIWIAFVEILKAEKENARLTQ